MKRGIFSFIFVILFGILLYYGAAYQKHLKDLAAITYNPYPGLLFSVLFPISLGILLGLPHVCKIIKSNGELVVDKYRLFFMGVLTLYASIMPIVYFSPASQYLPLGYFIVKYSDIPFIAGIAFPYIIITSFRKL